MSWIQTYTGRRFDPEHPDVAQIDLADIAHALSQSIRFAGHLTEPLTVAQHSVVASWIVPSRYALRALLHDGAEAYLSDVPSPIKALPEMAWFREIEDRVQNAIWNQFEIPVDPDACAIVRLADQMLVRAEAERWFADTPEWVTLYPKLVQDRADSEIPATILPLDRVWTPPEAKARFLERFCELDVARRA